MRSILIAICIPIVATAATAVTITTDTTIDAGNSFPGGNVEVFDGTSPPTTVTIVNGGVAGHIVSWDTSIVDMQGGSVGSIVSEAGSSFLMSGGTVGNYGNIDDTFFSFSGGTIGQIFGVSNVAAEITGGTVTGLMEIFGPGGGTLSDITVGGWADIGSHGGSWVITGGTFQDDLLIGGTNADAQLSGVSVAGDLRVGGSNTTATWSGGSVAGRLRYSAALDWSGGSVGVDVEGSNGAVMNVFGTDLSFMGGVLTGFLMDGTPLNTKATLLEGAQINLVPEPASSLLLCLGLAALGASRRGIA